MRLLVQCPLHNPWKPDLATLFSLTVKYYQHYLLHRYHTKIYQNIGFTTLSLSLPSISSPSPPLHLCRLSLPPSLPLPSLTPSLPLPSLHPSLPPSLFPIFPPLSFSLSHLFLSLDLSPFSLTHTLTHTPGTFSLQHNVGKMLSKGLMFKLQESDNIFAWIYLFLFLSSSGSSWPNRHHWCKRREYSYIIFIKKNILNSHCMDRRTVFTIPQQKYQL